MKILFASRKTLYSVPGGDTIQMEKTAQALRAIGCEVTISTELEPDVSTYDIVHLFNLGRPQECYLQALNAKRGGKRIALSTIYADFTEYDSLAREGIGGLLAGVISQQQFEYLKVISRALFNKELNKGTLLLAFRGFRKLQEQLIELTDLFLPNSESEYNRIASVFKPARNKNYFVVPNAVDDKIFDLRISGNAAEEKGFQNCVLCVARIEGVKNQLNLVRTMKTLPWKLLLVGNPSPNHSRYYDRVRNEAGSNVYFAGQLSHDALPSYYKAAKVHVLPSWMETTGLSTLEAAAMNCNIVVTDKGDTREYFGDYAYYCEPDSVDSIRNAIKQAFENPVDPALRIRVLDKYTWVKTAEKTLEGYELILNSSQSASKTKTDYQVKTGDRSAKH